MSEGMEGKVEGTGTVRIVLPLTITIQLGGKTVARVETGPEAEVESPDSTTLESVQINRDYGDRQGYDPDFLGIPIPLPALSQTQRDTASINRQTKAGADPIVFPYYNYSLVMHRPRRFALYTVVNVDGKQRYNLGAREGDRWEVDPRLPREEQVTGALYQGSHMDRGHLVRRLDAAWGATEAEARLSNDDTFHFTNCTPQHGKFNQNKSTWQGLEDFILNRALAEKSRVTIFNGPVFKADDPKYQQVQIPLAFWKIVLFRRAGGTGDLSATAYLLSQDVLIRDLLEESFSPRMFQVPVARIVQETGIDFSTLSVYDPMENSAEVNEVFQPGEPISTPSEEREIRDFDALML